MSDKRRARVTADPEPSVLAQLTNESQDALARLSAADADRLLKNGSEAMTGDLDMDTNDILNVGTLSGSVAAEIKARKEVLLFGVSKDDGGTITADASNPVAVVQDVVFNVEDNIPSGMTYDNTTGILTMGATTSGTGIVNVQLAADDATNRVNLTFEVQEDTGSGYTRIARSGDYIARDTDQNEGGASLAGRMVTFQKGASYKIVAAVNRDGTDVTYDTKDSCWWTIQLYLD